MKQNEYGEIYNCLENYREIAEILDNYKSIIIQWIDEDGLTLTILFSFNVKQIKGNYLQRGLRSTDLFVSIIPFSSYGFDIKNNLDIGYLQEKLKIKDEILAGKLASLINGIMINLRNMY